MEVDNRNDSETLVTDEMKEKKIELIKEFLELQAERCKAYNQLNESIGSAETQMQSCSFTEQMRLVTEAFRLISGKIIVIKEELVAMDFTLSAEAISELQELEQIKLRLTADVYIKQRMLKHKEDEQMEQDLVAVKKKLGELVVSINEYIEELRYQVFEGDF